MLTTLRAPAFALALVFTWLTWLGSPGVISPAQAQPAALTPSQSDALNAYNKAVSDFKSILGQRRAQIQSREPLPNVPGQALYLARNPMMCS